MNNICLPLQECKIHQGKVKDYICLNLQCKEEKQPFCSICLYNEHQEHKSQCISLENFVDLLKKSLAYKNHKLFINNSNIKTRYHQISLIFAQEKNKFHQLLNKTESEISNEIDTLDQTNGKSIKKQIFPYQLLLSNEEQFDIYQLLPSLIQTMDQMDVDQILKRNANQAIIIPQIEMILQQQQNEDNYLNEIKNKIQSCFDEKFNALLREIGISYENS